MLLAPGELQSFVDDVFKKGEEKAANKDEQLSFNEFLRAVKASCSPCAA